MKFIGDLLQIENEVYRVGFIHNMPFDEVHGLGKTTEELNQIGILVDDIPECTPSQGQIERGLFVNTATKELWWEYEPIPKTEAQLLQEQISDLNIAMAALMGGAV